MVLRTYKGRDSKAWGASPRTPRPPVVPPAPKGRHRGRLRCRPFGAGGSWVGASQPGAGAPGLTIPPLRGLTNKICENHPMEAECPTDRKDGRSRTTHDLFDTMPTEFLGLLRSDS